MTNWGELMRGLLDRLRGEPTPEERERHLKSTRRALYIERERDAIERRLDAVLGSHVDVVLRRTEDHENHLTD